MNRQPQIATDGALLHSTKLRELIRSISTEDKDDDSNEVELTHDQLMDEDVEYNTNTCGYFKATSDTEMTLLEL